MYENDNKYSKTKKKTLDLPPKMRINIDVDLKEYIKKVLR
jgi:hypothetical protein